MGHAANQLEVENAKIRGMIEALDLTPKEEHEIDHEVGIRHYNFDGVGSGERAPLAACCQNLVGTAKGRKKR